MTKMDPNKMMAQLGQMQAQMEKAQEELKTAYVEHSRRRRRGHREGVGRARGGRDHDQARGDRP